MRKAKAHWASAFGFVTLTLVALAIPATRRLAMPQLRNTVFGRLLFSAKPDHDLRWRAGDWALLGAACLLMCAAGVLFWWLEWSSEANREESSSSFFDIERDWQTITNCPSLARR